MAANWWAMTPWWVYLVWTALATGAIVWFGWQGNDHKLSVRNKRAAYQDHSGSEIYNVNLSKQHFLDMKGDDNCPGLPLARRLGFWVRWFTRYPTGPESRGSHTLITNGQESTLGGQLETY